MDRSLLQDILILIKNSKINYVISKIICASVIYNSGAYDLQIEGGKTLTKPIYFNRYKRFFCMMLALILVLTSTGWSGNNVASAATTWTTVTSNTNQPIYKVAYGNGMWVAVGVDGSDTNNIKGLVLTSTDGATWAKSNLGAHSLNNVIYAGGQWVVIGDNFSAFTSNDAVTWTARTVSNVNEVINLSGISYGNSKYVIVGNLGNIYYSSDAITWTNTKPASDDFLGVAYGNNIFVAVGANGIAYSSPDGVNWTNRGPIAGSSSLYSVRFLNGSFYATSDGKIVTSTNGTSWNAPQSISGASATVFYDIAYNTGKYVLVGDIDGTFTNGVILTSSNGTSWTSETPNATPVLYGIASSSNQFTAVGDAGSIRTQAIAPASTDATLNALSINQGILSPTFASGTTSYTASVAFGVTTINITPTVNQANATVKVNGTATTSGTARTVSLSVGSNPIPVEVTAQDGTTTKTYTITVTRAGPSTNANLSSLAISQGTLSPSFASGTTSYTANVTNNVTSLTVTPTVANSNATVTVNGVTVTSGNASGSIALAVGSNMITTIVTAQDGSTTQTYTVTVTRAAAPSTNANLSSLAISQGMLSPSFASGTTSYTASVANNVTSLTVTPTVSNTNATVTVNGATVTSGNASGSIALAVGSNTITTVVTAEDGTTTQTYTVTVTRAAPPSINADLSALSISSGTLSPAFASGTTNYTASVNNATTSLTITPTLADATASVTVNGVAVSSGNASGAIALNVGSNTITTVVTAQEGSTTKSYTITVTRAANSNNNLGGLSISSGTLSPTYNSATPSYTASVSNATTSITVTPTTAVNTASVTVNGNAVTSGNASQSIPLNVGSNTITITVTAQNGSPKTYTITVTRAVSINANLTNLVLSQGILSPTFASGTTSYTASVGYNISSLTVTPTVADSAASVTVNGVAVSSGNASQSIALNVGNNTITTIVTAQDGTTTKTYTTTVTRAAATNNANLANLLISAGTLSPAFDATVTSYTASVNDATSNISVTPTTDDPNAVVRIDSNLVTSGTATIVGLATGNNSIVIEVTASDNSIKTYTLQVKRLQNPNLSNLTISAGTLNPVFDTATTSYTATVNYSSSTIQVTPTTIATPQQLTVAGINATSATATTVPLAVGSNTIPVVITMTDGTTQTYTITVTRNNISDADAVSEAYNTLVIGYATGDSESSVTQNLTLPTTGINATTVNWTTNNPSLIQNNGTVTRPSYPNPDVTVTLNALIQKNAALSIKTFTVVVKSLPITDVQAVAEDMNALQVQYANGDTANAVTQNVGLALTGSNNTVITWESSNPQRVSSTGTVTRSTYSEGDQNVRLTAQVQRGSVTDTKTFDLIIKAKSASSGSNLKGLTVNGLVFSPAFNPEINNYNMSVSNATNNITVTASVYNSDATITVNGKVLADAGTSDSIALSVGENVVTIIVTAQNGATQSYTITIKRDKKSDSGSGGGGSSNPDDSSTRGTNPGTTEPTTPSTSSGFEIIVNGRQIEQIATGVLNQQNGQSVFTATVDTDKLGNLLANEGNAPQVIIPVKASADKINTVLTGEAVQILAGAQATLRIETVLGNYTLPSTQLRIQQLAGELGNNANSAQLEVNVTITRSTDAVINALNNRAARDGFIVAVAPVDFNVTATYNNQTSAVNEFTTYVKRELPIPATYDPSRITTAVVVDAQQNIHHVPTAVAKQGEAYYAVVNSLTNSNYGLIWNPEELSDVANHWSKSAVNDMASRLIVNGVDATHFNPNSNVTRAEFAAIVVRALGLSDTGTSSKFTDVSTSDWYMGAVTVANNYNLIDGYEDGTFRPTQTISRQEAFVILNRAIAIVKLQQTAGSATLSSYSDQNKVATWAQTATQAVLSSGVV